MRWLPARSQDNGNFGDSGVEPHYGCPIPTRSVHSYRRRHLQHLHCAGQTLYLSFAIRLWYCRNPSCPRQVFAESLAPFADARQQSTPALQKLQHQLGLIAGGEAGKRAATATGVQIGADTLLRRVVQAPEQIETMTPHVGIDEWAWHRGHRYGTPIVNLDTHRLLVLLPGREQKSLAAWFRKYPEIQVVSRDRVICWRSADKTGRRQMASSEKYRWCAGKRDVHVNSILREVEAGISARELCRKHAISDATFYT